MKRFVTAACIGLLLFSFFASKQSFATFGDEKDTDGFRYQVIIPAHEKTAEIIIYTDQYEILASMNIASNMVATDTITGSGEEMCNRNVRLRIFGGITVENGKTKKEFNTMWSAIYDPETLRSAVIKDRKYKTSIQYEIVKCPFPILKLQKEKE